MRFSEPWLFFFFYFRPSVDQEAALREVEFELSRIERERREVASQIRAWERSFRVENNRNPTNEEKLNNTDYIRYRHLKGRHKFLQEMLTQRAPGSFTVWTEISVVHSFYSNKLNLNTNFLLLWACHSSYWDNTLLSFSGK